MSNTNISRKSLTVLLAVLLSVLSFASCKESGNELDYESDLTPAHLLDRMIKTATELEAADGETYLESGLIYRSDSDVDGESLTSGQQSIFYGGLSGAPDFSVVENYAVWIAQDTVATELGVFKVNDKADIETVKSFLNERVATLKQNAAGYMPEEEAKAEKAAIITRGRYVVYLVTNINDNLISALESSLSE